MTFLALWGVLELLIYESRYQWNDLRGLYDDTNHVERRARARLPRGRDDSQTRRNIVLSVAVAVLRLGLAVVIGYILGLSSTVVSLVYIVLLTAGLYEWLRTHRNENHRPSLIISIAIWLTVGVGYAVRAALGLALAGVPLTSVPGLIGIVCFYAFGIMFVLQTWVLEATSFHSVDAYGWHRTDDLDSKPHIEVLLAYLAPLEPANPLLDESRHPGKTPILANGADFWAPWNVALGLAVTAGGALGIYLAGAMTPLPAIFFAELALIGAVMLARADSTRLRLVVLCVGAVTLYAAASDVPRPLMAVLPWLVIGGWYTAFSASSYFDITHAVGKFVVVAGSAGARAIEAIVGQGTWKAASFQVALKQWADTRLESGGDPESNVQRPPTRPVSIGTTGRR
jgi:hypothetical protein